MQNNPLFQAILKQPHDESLRLIFADWIEEQGDSERAEFIRLQCELYSRRDSSRSAERWTRSQYLLRAHQSRWNGELHRFLAQGPLKNQVHTRRSPIRRWEYRRGFVEVLHAEASALANHADIVLQLGPLRYLTLCECRGTLQQALQVPWLEQITRLVLRGVGLDREDLFALINSPHLENLTTLQLRLGFQLLGHHDLVPELRNRFGKALIM